MKRLKRNLKFIAAVIFLFEAWLWDTLSALLEKAVALLPWEHVKARVAAALQHATPVMCLLVFIIPALLIFPLKVIGVWLMAHHHALMGVLVFVLAKITGLGVTAFLFETCKEKLLQLRWVFWLYHLMLRVRDWARAQVRPVRELMHRLRKKMGGRPLYLLELLKRLRRRMTHRAQAGI